MPGIGDAEGELDPYNREMGLYVPAFVGTLGELLDELGEQLAVSRFVLAGLCSGAYWAFHAARRDPRVAAAALINPRVLVLDVRERWVRSELGKAGGLQGWKKVLRGQVSPRAVLGRARRLLAHLAGLVLARGRGADPDDLEAMLDELRDERRQITLAFALGEPFEQTLEEEGILGRLERWPNVAVRRLDGYDHTLRPLTLQTAGHAIIDDVLMGATERAA
jgi:pimeloyl-ACP methyl ester carboxylesterase